MHRGEFGHALEAQVEHRSALDGESRLEAIGLVRQPLGADHRLPEPAQSLRLGGVEDEVLQVHAPTVDPSGRGCPGGPGRDDPRHLPAVERRARLWPESDPGATMTGMSVTTDTAGPRSEIEGMIEGRTVAAALAATVEQYGDHPAYSDKADGRDAWRTFTWQQMYDAARDVAAALVDAGVEPGRTVAIMATNRIEHLVADMGAVLAGAVPMSIYNTLSPDQIAFIAGQARPAAVFVETADHLERRLPALGRHEDVAHLAERIPIVRRRLDPPEKRLIGFVVIVACPQNLCQP